MNYIVFKLNVQPNILLKYEKNNEIKHLLSYIIPLAFESVLQIKEHKSFFELIPDQEDEQEFRTLLDDLESKTNELYKLYEQILLHYRNHHEIHYSQKFLKLNDKCMNMRRFLENKYPGVTKAYKIIEDENIERYANIDVDSKVGTAITHLRKFHKIKFYIEKYKEDNIINSLNLKSYYNPNTEHILVNSKSETAAINYITALVNLLNNNSSAIEHIGKININPVYESISLDGEYNEINYVIVYPNGNPPMDRYNILKEVEAKEIESKLVGADGKPLKNEPIQMMIEEDAKKGYLKSI